MSLLDAEFSGPIPDSDVNRRGHNFLPLLRFYFRALVVLIARRGIDQLDMIVTLLCLILFDTFGGYANSKNWAATIPAGI